MPRPFLVKLNVYRQPLNAGEIGGFAPQIARQIVARKEGFWCDKDGNPVSKPVRADLPAAYGMPAPDPVEDEPDKAIEASLAKPEKRRKPKNGE